MTIPFAVVTLPSTLFRVGVLVVLLTRVASITGVLVVVVVVVVVALIAAVLVLASSTEALITLTRVVSLTFLMRFLVGLGERSLRGSLLT